MDSRDTYSAKDAYKDYSAATEYERLRFSGVMGRYRWRQEQRAVERVVQRMPSGVTVLDCPCGTGRWWDVLSQRASKIIGIDVSEGMLRYARERADGSSLDITLHQASAEELPFEDGSVDFTFSHALTKHMPWSVQAIVLAEFARVSRAGVICSFGIFNHLTYEIWRRRGLTESYPMLPEELAWMAGNAGLVIEDIKKCTTSIGVEHTVFFKKD
jgi:ubiquinone/menaquinone biosynthesis C-methylase UbiE